MRAKLGLTDPTPEGYLASCWLLSHVEGTPEVFSLQQTSRADRFKVLDMLSASIKREDAPRVMLLWNDDLGQKGAAAACYQQQLNSRHHDRERNQNAPAANTES